MSRQAWITDVNRFFRTGGIDWDRLADTFDAVGIMGWIGDFLDPCYEEFVEAADARNIDYFTLHIPKPSFPIDEAVDIICELPGVAGHPIGGDIEPTDGEMVNEYQARKFFEGLAAKRGQAAWYYSNYNYTKRLGFPQWVKPLVKYWAEYPFDVVTKYRKLDRYLEKNPWKIPKWAVSCGYTPEMHQCSDYGDAQFYYANLFTDDPQNPKGKLSCDLGVSLIDVDELKLLFKPPVIVPPLEERVSILESQVASLNERVLALEGSKYITLRAKERFPLGVIVDHDAACFGEDPPGKPIVEHPPVGDRIILEAGDTIRAHVAFRYSCKDDPSSPVIFAAGMVPYYVAIDGYPGRISLIRADLVDQV